ncbi:MAG: DUF1501 domain-containing protein [Bryobacteraceae bacterium]|nr:DUF1501 domain-containing protein [Bryobacterales bacterium]MEB2360237.1 DUF1501 domain-containing protein [Bryobacterales bacterium]NUM99894.1 DUF1501 domain-containing protein [Bryobacteraceae bacterium]
MLRLDADRAAEFCDGLRRRDFLHAGSLSFLGLGLTQMFGLKALGAVDNRKKDINCIFLMLVGGPSQLDTWDMKPDAPVEIRGPYRPIKTNVPGIEVSENFPRMAKNADKFALVRSVYHTAAAVHDTGHQMMQTGRLFQGGVEHPHIGCVLGKLKGPNGGVPAHVLLPGSIGSTGGNMPHGQNAGYLGKTYDPFVLNADPSDPNFRVPDTLPPEYLAALRVDRRRNWRELVDRTVSKFETSQDGRLSDASFHQAYTLMSSAKAREAFELHREPEAVRQKYGMNRFGQSCLLARRMIEAGVRFVTVNMFETVFDEITWDIHGSKPFSPISCYSDLVGPMFDNAYSSLLEDLHERGLLETTMVVATGEFGRTPKVNPAGGRDHWPQCWTMLLGGGGIKGGQVIGSSDEIGALPKDRPTSPAEIAATIYYGLGIDLELELPGAQGRPLPLVDRGVQPVRELFS